MKTYFSPRFLLLVFWKKNSVWLSFWDFESSNFIKTSLKIFKHYKLKPSFSIIKDDKAKDFAPTDLINLIHLYLFWSNLNPFDPAWSDLTKCDPNWTNFNWFEPNYQSDPIWTNFIWFEFSIVRQTTWQMLRSF